MSANDKKEVIDLAIAALEAATKFTNIGFDFDGDVFGIHHNDACDALSDYANAIAELKTLRDAV